MFDETPDYGRAIQWQAEQIEQARLERGEYAAQVYAALRGLFYSAALSGDLKAKAEWAPMFRDYSAERGADGECPRRHPTTAELMFESLDYSGGPSIDDVLQIISAAATGQDVQEQAKDLIKRMAETWADRNLDEVLE